MQCSIQHHAPSQTLLLPASVGSFSTLLRTLGRLQRIEDLLAHRRWNDFVPLTDKHHRASREAAWKVMRGSSSSSACIPSVTHERAQVAVRQPALRVECAEHIWHASERIFKHKATHGGGILRVLAGS